MNQNEMKLNEIIWPKFPIGPWWQKMEQQENEGSEHLLVKEQLHLCHQMCIFVLQKCKIVIKDVPKQLLKVSFSFVSLIYLFLCVLLTRAT